MMSSRLLKGCEMTRISCRSRVNRVYQLPDVDEVFVVRNEHEVVALVPVERQDFLHVAFMVELG